MITCVCPHCGEVLSYLIDRLGRTEKCPGCNREFTVIKEWAKPEPH